MEPFEPPAEDVASRELPAADVGAPLRYRVLRQDDHGGRFEVARTATRCEASAIVERYTRRLHHQIYWLEEL